MKIQATKTMVKAINKAFADNKDFNGYYVEI